MNTKAEQQLFTFPRLRTSNGRYCTEEQFRREKVYNENRRLWHEKEKYFRAWQAAALRVAALEREIKRLKENG